jgi:DNA (cytosine-5)-methyltransferase 1
MTTNQLTLIGLFAGIGGIERGFENAGFKSLIANEIDEYAAKTYQLNHSHDLVVADIKDISKESLFISGEPEISVLAGGFPCQPFSVAGYRKGFEDERGNVFWEIHRLINELHPRVVFLENVKNLETHDGGNTFRTIKGALEGTISDPDGVKLATGYTVKSVVLNAKDFGIPQNRERIYIVGFREASDAEKFTFPVGKDAKRPLRPLSDFIDFDAKVEDKYYYTSERPMYEELNRSIIDSGTVYQWRRQYVRANKSGVCPTLTANMGMGGHNVPLVRAKHGIRKLTPKECFSLMGFENPIFPDKMAESRLYKQAGNAVVVPVIEAIAKNIRLALK